MFEHIHFMTEESLTDFEKLSTDPRYESSYETFVRDNPDAIEAMKGEFLMEGNVKALFELPMAEKSHMQLLYIQSFSWMKMGRNYYTHRQNYQSYLLLYTYEGQGELEYDGRKYTLKRGDGFLIDCRREHSYRTVGERWEHSDLHFQGGASEYLYEQCFAEKSPVFHCPLSRDYQHLLEQTLASHTSTDRYREYQTSAWMNQLLMLVLSLQSVTQQEDVIPENIIYLQRYLEHHFIAEPTIDEMAKFCGISKYYMIRQFKKYTSFSPKEYVTSLRITRAKQLLMDTQIAAYKIGIMVGIENEANFIRTFKLQVGMTPGEYRRQMSM